MAVVMTSCNQKNKQEEALSIEKTQTSSKMYACSMHPEVIGKKAEKCSKCGMDLTEPVEEVLATTESGNNFPKIAITQTGFSIDEIVTNYLTLKNALVKDDSKASAMAGKTLFAVFNAINATTVDAKQKKEYLEIADNAKEHVEHIANNAGKLKHQREHFVMLSKDINDLIATFGTKQKLYQDFCPMADEGKGAIWISEVKDIKNPYFGSEMLTCGSVKKVL